MTTEGTSEADEVVFLMGRPPMSEYIGFVSNQTVAGDQADQQALSAQWRAANDHVKALSRAESGVADNALVAEIDPTLKGLCDQVTSDEYFKKSFAIVPATLGLVELDRLVVFQKFINQTFANSLAERLGPDPKAEEIFRFCLPFDHPTPVVRSGRVAQNAFIFHSPSNDFRFLDATLLSPNQISGHKTNGPPSAYLAIVVGFGSNYMNAVNADGRLVLNNGSHRAYALRSLGVTHAPCVIQHVSRREELELIVPALHDKPDQYLVEPRPSLLKDYFDPLLRSVHHMVRRNRQVKLSFGVEQVDVPA
jgi:hypothetical protein